MKHWPEPGTLAPAAVRAVTVTIALSGDVCPVTRFTVTGIVEAHKCAAGAHGVIRQRFRLGAAHVGFETAQPKAARGFALLPA